jgi:hypothetical protein
VVRVELAKKATEPAPFQAADAEVDHWITKSVRMLVFSFAGDGQPKSATIIQLSESFPNKNVGALKGDELENYDSESRAMQMSVVTQMPFGFSCSRAASHAIGSKNSGTGVVIIIFL